MSIRIDSPPSPQDIALRVALADWIASKTGRTVDASAWDIEAMLSHVKDEPDQWNYSSFRTADVTVTAKATIRA